MSSEFIARIDELIDAVGEGDIMARVEVAQPYAIPQERGFWETGPLAGHVIRNHPGGGQTHAMTEAVIPWSDDYMQTMADSLITEDGSDIREGAKQVAHSIARHYKEYAPIKSGALRGSTREQVIEDGLLTWNRPPDVPPGGIA